MRVLVTGGAGFIGSHVAHALLESGHEVAVLDDLSTGRRANVPPAATFFEADIRDREAVDGVFKAFRPQAVSHQAAQASVVVSTREPARDAEVNVIGSIHLLQASVEHSVQRFVFASTGGAIYGEVEEGRSAAPDTPPNPLSPYACAKFAVEAYLGAYRALHGLSSTVLRYANVYGPRQDPHGEAGVVAIFMQRLLEGKPVQINARRRSGDDGCVRDYVYVADVAGANLAALDGRLAEPVVNVGTGVGITTRQLLTTLESVLAVEARVSRAERRDGDLERSVLAPSDALPSPTSLDEGMGRTAAWFRSR